MKRFGWHINKHLNLRLCVNVRFDKLLSAGAFIGGVLFLVTLFAACGAAVLPEEADEVEYTDVEYSEDGSQVTLYLDGVGVPATPKQRAMTKDLAQTAYDFVEVIFTNGTFATSTNIARTSWVLGQPSSISNVTRGIDYGSIFANNGNSACMFVGKDDGKVLLGIGKLTGTKAGNVASTSTIITIDTTSVTFTLSAIQTGLCISGETAGTGSNPVADSLLYTSDQIGYTGKTPTNTFRKAFTTGGTRYPVFCLPSTGSPITMEYSFSLSGNPANYFDAVRHSNTTTVLPAVQKRTPRYAEGSRYKEPRNSIDTTTTVAIGSTYTSAVTPANSSGVAFTTTVPLVFTIGSGGKTGIFSFNMQIPVFMVCNTPAGKNSNGTTAVTWFIRTGVGSEFFSLDDGFYRGGCVLMSCGILTDAGLNNIEWTWFKGF